MQSQDGMFVGKYLEQFILNCRHRIERIGRVQSAANRPLRFVQRRDLRNAEGPGDPEP